MLKYIIVVVIFITGLTTNIELCAQESPVVKKEQYLRLVRALRLLNKEQKKTNASAKQQQIKTLDLNNKLDSLIKNVTKLQQETQVSPKIDNASNTLLYTLLFLSLTAIVVGSIIAIKKLRLQQKQIESDMVKLKSEQEKSLQLLRNQQEMLKNAQEELNEESNKTQIDLLKEFKAQIDSSLTQYKISFDEKESEYKKNMDDIKSELSELKTNIENCDERSNKTSEDLINLCEKTANISKEIDDDFLRLKEEFLATNEASQTESKKIIDTIQSESINNIENVNIVLDNIKTNMNSTAEEFSKKIEELKSTQNTVNEKLCDQLKGIKDHIADEREFLTSKLSNQEQLANGRDNIHKLEMDSITKVIDSLKDDLIKTKEKLKEKDIEAKLIKPATKPTVEHPNQLDLFNDEFKIVFTDNTKAKEHTDPIINKTESDINKSQEKNTEDLQKKEITENTLFENTTTDNKVDPIETNTKQVKTEQSNKPHKKKKKRRKHYPRYSAFDNNNGFSNALDSAFEQLGTDQKSIFGSE